jgi:hypothetical protein
MKVRVCRKFVTIETFELDVKSKEEALTLVADDKVSTDDSVDFWESAGHVYLENEGGGDD